MKSAPRSSRQRLSRQHGQALVLTIAFSAVIAIMVFFLFSSAQLVNQKTKLQNTADAAAYSAGVLQARDYNFSAYTNRAMVGNHVGVAQFVGLESWTEEVQKEFVDDSCLVFPGESKCWSWHAASTGNATWNRPARIAAGFANAARNEFNKEKVVARSLPLVITALRDAQVAYHETSLLQFGDSSVIGGVVKANDPNAEVSRSLFADATIAKDVLDWTGYTKDMSTLPEVRRLASVAVDTAGQDGFTKSRNTPIRLLPVIASTMTRNPLYAPQCITAISSQIALALSHGGGTQLSSDLTHWSALDAAGATGFWRCTILVPDPFDPIMVIGLPITSFSMDFLGKGAGGGSAGTGGYAVTGFSTPRTSSSFYGGFLGALANPAFEIQALIRFGEGPGATHNVAPAYKGMKEGIKQYYDVTAYATTPTNQVDPANLAPALTIEVEKKGANIRTAAQAVPGNDLLKLNDSLKGDVMRTVATAQAYFMRPEHADHRRLLNASYVRTDSKTEYASLYNPYWQVRLVPTPQLLVDGSVAAQ